MKDKPVILVVDDEPQNIELLEVYLVPQGYEIVKAASGEEALGKLSDNQIDLILLDVKMPGMDGFEVTHRIRQDNAHRQLPIILITVLQETEDRVKGFEAGCDDFISYPVDKIELLARVRSLLKVKAYNDLMSNYRKELESEVTGKTEELKQALENLQQDVTKRKRVESQREALFEEIRKLNEELERRVIERTTQLEAVNKELETFSYSVSHDLRAPLRGIAGFSEALLEDYRDKLDATGKNYLERIRAGAQSMGLLIDDILKLSRVTRAEFKRESVNLSKMIQDILLTVRQNNPARDVKVNIQKDIIINGDRQLLEIALTNLIDNAWKFTGKTKKAHIEFGTLLTDGKPVMFLRDDGVGFDMLYVDKLFGVFQRLHTKDEFMGTGIGLATVQRIIRRHGGKIWAEGEVGKGATFYFTLPT